MDRRSGGFTLIEVMIVVMIMAIVLAFGIPAFGDLVDKTRVRTAAEAVIEAFRVARLTAVQERIAVVMCPWNNADACSGDDWEQGIMILKPGTTNTVVYRMRFDERLHVVKNNHDSAAHDEININPNGWIPGDQSSILICPEPGNIKNAQRLVISMSGKIRTETDIDEGACGSAG